MAGECRWEGVDERSKERRAAVREYIGLVILLKRGLNVFHHKRRRTRAHKNGHPSRRDGCWTARAVQEVSTVHPVAYGGTYTAMIYSAEMVFTPATYRLHPSPS